MARKRIIYQSEALYAGKTGEASPKQIHRVQDISHSVEVSRTDVNEFGKLAALSREVIEVPTVSLDYSYYAVDGHNEATGVGLVVSAHNAGANQAVNCLSGIMASDSTSTAEKNYYIRTVPEGSDAVGNTEHAKQGMIGVGNGFVTSYGFSASVGEIPSASVSVEASNLRFDTSGSDITNPAINFADGGPVKGGRVSPPTASTGNLKAMAVRPGDITVDFGSDLLQQGGAVLPGMTVVGDVSSACLQSVSIDLPLSRTPLQCLGSTFPKSRELDLPITTSMSCSANVADISSGDLNSLLCNDASERTITVSLRARDCDGDGDKLLTFQLKGAQLDSQGMSSSIGDNKTVDLNFSAQVGGPEDTKNGLFISGSK